MSRKELLKKRTEAFNKINELNKYKFAKGHEPKGLNEKIKQQKFQYKLFNAMMKNEK